MTKKQSLVWQGEDLVKGVKSHQLRVIEAVYKLGMYWAAQMETYAKSHHKWKDRSGAATSGIRATVTREGRNTVINLYHTAEHGIWLEVRWAGKFAILMPTIDLFGPRVLDSLRKLLK